MPENETTTALLVIKPEAKIEVMPLYDQALKLLKIAEQRVIATVEDLKPATDDLVIISNVKKVLEEKRKEYVQPLRNQVEAINNAFKVLEEPIDLADELTQGKILAFGAELKRIRQEQEEINRLRKEAAEKDAALHNGEISESVNLVKVVPEAPKRVSTDMGTTTTRHNWKWKVIDFDLVPREYLVIDGSQLTAIAKAHHDQHPVAGIEFYNEPIIAVNVR